MGRRLRYRDQAAAKEAELKKVSADLEEKIKLQDTIAPEIADLTARRDLLRQEAGTARAEMEELSPVEVSLSGTPGEVVPVTLESLVTETGMLELWFVARDGRRWKLGFNVRPTRRS